MSETPSSAQQSLIKKFEFFDFLVFVYFAAFVREYFWILPHNALAWSFTAIVSLALSAIYLRVKDTPEERPPLVFWVIVSVPLFLIYSLRAAYPDLSFDVLNYHIFHSERALRGLLYIHGDFAPAYFPFLNNPVADIITGIFRHLLGFRLGTIINYLALVWTGAILFQFLRRYIPNQALRSVSVLLILLSEQLLFEISNYMIDLLALPVLLQATLLVVRKDEEPNKWRKNLILVLLLLGMSVALKLTNLVFAVPLGFLALHRFATIRTVSWPQYPRMALEGIAAFVLPILPYATYVYWLTGSPTFPYFNKIFRSPYWPIENAFDGRWGPRGAIETLLWAFEVFFKPQRLTELNVYSGRISLGLLSACLLLILGRRDYCLRAIALITIAGSVLWSAGTGYIRYGLYLEVLGGIAVVALSSLIWKSHFQPVVLRQMAAILAWCALVAQTGVGASYVLMTEWGGRPTALEHPLDYKAEVTQLLRDRSLTQYLTADQVKLFNGVDVWVESSYKTSGMAVMLRNDLPYLNVFADNFVGTPAALERFQTALATDKDRKMLSLVFEEDLKMALSKLENRGLTALEMTPLKLPYYSPKRTVNLIAIDVAPKPKTLARSISNSSGRGSPFGDNDKRGHQPHSSPQIEEYKLGEPEMKVRGSPKPSLSIEGQSRRVFQVQRAGLRPDDLKVRVGPWWFGPDTY